MSANRVVFFRGRGFFLGVAVILGALQSVSGQTNRLPSTTLTTGGRFSDDVNLGVIDILQPVYSENNTMLLLNPRIAFNDVSEEEFNIGFVARHLLPEKNMIVGGNIFFDRRHTGFGNYFSQLGLGAEILTPMIDARINVYIPDDDHKLVGEDEVTASSSSSSSRTSTEVSKSISTSTATVPEFGELAARRNAISQDVTLHRTTDTIETTTATHTTRRTTTTTTTRMFFEQYEEALEGWDAEAGVKIPNTPHWMETRLFAGYYSFNGDWTADIEGFKARAEVRLQQALMLDAEYMEDDELFGSDYYVGFRLQVPFDFGSLAHGRNPFEGAFTPPEEDLLRSRLGREMVMRDLAIQTALTKPEENLSRRQTQTTSSTQTSVAQQSTSQVIDTAVVSPVIRVPIERNVKFVDPSATGNGVGTAEAPFSTIQEAVDNVFGVNNVYVFEGLFNENVVISTEGVSMLSEAKEIRGFGGKTFGGGATVTIDGNVGGVNAPGIRVTAHNVTITGYEVMHSPGGINPGSFDNVRGEFQIDQVGILGENADNLTLICNDLHDNSWGALAVASDQAPGGVTDYNFTGRDNVGHNNTEDGLRVDAISGNVRDAQPGGTGGGGLEPVGSYEVSVTGSDFNDNSDEGLRLNASGFATVDVTLDDIDVLRNGDNGFELEVDLSNDVTLDVNNLTASFNDDDGIDLQDWNVFGKIDITLTDVESKENSSDGIDFEDLGSSGDVTLRVLSSDISENFDDGLDLDDLDAENLTVIVRNTTLSDNEETGFDMEDYDVESHFSATFQNLEINGNDSDGLIIETGDSDTATVLIQNTDANENEIHGIKVDLDTSGDASITIRDVVANDSQVDEGVHLDINSDAGLARVLLNRVNADRNSFDGLDDQNVDIDIDTGGNVDIDLLNVSANESGFEGIGMEIMADGDINIDFRNVTSNDNPSDGINLDDLVAGGDINLNFRRVEASNNEEDGIDIDNSIAAGLNIDFANITSSENGEDGVDFEFWRIANHVEASFRNLEANGNDANGFLVEDGQSNTANLLIDPSEASNNDAHGFRALLNTESDTSITVLDATANGNVSEGVHVTINNNTGTGRILLNRITANDSPDDDGVDVEVHSGGDVDVDLLNIAAGNNDGVGVEIDLTAGGAQIVTRNSAQIPVGGDIDLNLERITAAMNGDEGIDLNMAAGGNIFITGRRNSVHDNTLDGVRLNATAFGTVDADFGEFDLLAFANLFNLGLNSFFNNGLLDMNNVNPGDHTINAEGNFWGTTTPTIGEEISDGVNAAIPLPFNVNP